MSVRAIVEELKAAGQDFEFYPTTREIIDCVLGHYDSDDRDWRSRNANQTVLDVGAGHGAFLNAFAEKHATADLLAVEKSPILMAELVKFAKVIGTDFHTQTFMSKNVDVLFCNPPYSEYENWAARLIRECPAKAIYLVIPRRWSESALITDAITFREAAVETIGSFTFEDGERAARAKVDVLCVTSEVSSDGLFDKFFAERFGPLQRNFEENAAKKEKERTDSGGHRQRLVERNGLVGALVSLYEAEMRRLQENYEKAAGIDPAVMMELGLNVSAIVTTLREKIASMKDRYWVELFGVLDTVTKRLTSKNRRKMLETIGGFKAVDFNEQNIYAVLLWVIENANKYIDQQIIDVFDDMVESANIVNYKSNQRVYGNGVWRYGSKPENLSHISLDYRVVLTRCHGMVRDYGRTRLGGRARDFIVDLITVANLLGIPAATDDPRLTESNYGDSSFWKPGRAQLFKTLDGDDLVEVRAHLNGNLHVRMSQKLALALNVAMGRLRGWLRDHSEAAAEFGPEAANYFEIDPHVNSKQLLLSAG